jgi:hypothetical protein
VCIYIYAIQSSKKRAIRSIQVSEDSMVWFKERKMNDFFQVQSLSIQRDVLGSIHPVAVIMPL